MRKLQLHHILTSKKTEMTKEQLNEIIATSGNAELIEMAKAELQKLELQEKAAAGDDLSKTLLVLKDTIDSFKKNNPGAGGYGGKLTQKQIDEIVRQATRSTLVSYDDLDTELKQKLAGQIKIQLTLQTPYSKNIASNSMLLRDFERPLMQKLLSDYKARNNAYLFGGAGTGKTFIASQIADFLGYKLITVNCNQFTSPLDLVGGQTINGYQKGRLEMAWSNIDENDNQVAGCILLLDELPKLDPNTAGILNEALAKVKDFKNGTEPPIIRNGRGEELKLGNMFVIATGNTKLNEVSTEYEANFKQDLSLQDRFAGSTYEVFVDYAMEFENIMQDFAFIWIYMTRLREAILKNKMTGQAFVSIRIMMSMKDTYIVYRTAKDQQVTQNMSLTSPKTIKQALDSFLNLFKPNQISVLKDETGYDNFIEIVNSKMSRPLTDLNTETELVTAREMIRTNANMIASKTI